LNALFSIDVTLFNVIVANAEQFSKEDSPIDKTFGIVIFVNLVESLNI